MKFAIIFFLSLAFSFKLSAQFEQKYSAKSNSPDWVKFLYEAPADPQKVIAAYELYYQSHSLVKSEHTQYYKRWLRSFSRELSFSLFSKVDQDYVNRSVALREQKDFDSEWICIGPYDFDKEASSRSYAPGAAHIYTVERSFSNSNIMFAGSATAGLWKSSDAGSTWVLMTRDLVLNRIFALEIDHVNPDIVYFESNGDLYKTIDGGESWSIIGDPVFQSESHNVKDIVMHPNSSSEIYLTSNRGFFKSTDSGSNWIEIMDGEFQEIELNPANSSILYTIKVVDNHTEFYKSSDGGDSFTIQTNGWPNPTGTDDHQERVEIAVTPANPSLIYANATGSANGGSGTYGIYLSEDQGASWTFQCCGEQPAGPPSLTNINMMGWDKEGEDDGGQYYYDVGFAVDPINANKLHLGGVNHWVSNDAGVTWVCPAKWSEPGEMGYVHADIHDIRFFGMELWIACDGGIFMSSDGGITMNKSQVGIEGTDFWGFGASPQTDVMLGGVYHNGTLLKDNDTYINDWICTGGGDGVRGFVNFGNDRIAYDDYEGRILSGDRTMNINGFQFDSLPNASYIFGESSTMEWDPRNNQHIYLGRGTNLLKTEDNGLTFEIVHSFDDLVMNIEISRANLDVIYLCTNESWWGDKKIWRTQDGGLTWSEITPPSALLNGDLWVPFDIAVSASDENVVWAARTSQYGNTNLNGRMVFKSTNGGATWGNYTSNTIDGEVITNIEHQKGTAGGVYIGTRRAVYYRNNSMNEWALFNNNLPLSSTSTKLVIKYKDGLLRNATNRSVYEVELYEESQPMAQIAADKFKVSCLNNQVQFMDHSVLSSSNPSWSWSFPGGEPNSSSEQNPLVGYDTPGFYDVTLVVTDDFGTSTQSYAMFIEYKEDLAPLDIVEDFELGITDFWTQYNENNSFGWSPFFTENGPDCEATNCVMVNHYSISQVGDEAELMTPKIDLSNSLSAMLEFDYAYTKWGGTYEDGFHIDISADCWESYDTLFYAFGDDLITIPSTNDEWYPSDCADWSANNSIDLSSYLGQNVAIRFVAINGWGNNFFMDNINVMGQLSGVNQLVSPFSIFPNPSKGKFTIAHALSNPDLVIYSADGRILFNTVLQTTQTMIDLDVKAGVYIIHVNDGVKTYVEKITIH
ncbi:MAG: T9SS type A sorting domain-containing protein [Crocinitomicaceae bacterium]